MGGRSRRTARLASAALGAAALVCAVAAAPAVAAPPDTTILTGPAPGATVASRTATFTFESSNSSAFFQCSVDNPAPAAFVPCGPVTPAKSGSATVIVTTDGPHTFYVRSSDDSGPRDWDPTPASRTWTVDTAPPDTTITGGPTGTTTETSATFTFTSEAGATFECQLDGGAFAACTSPRAYTGLAPGAHSFAVRARDAAGNVDPTPATRAWTISAAPGDTTPPDTTITAGPTGTTSDTSASFSFTSSEPNSTFECRLDAAAFAACTSPRAYTGLAPGAHTFAVRARDAAGNVDPTPATRAWTISAAPGDTTPPDTTITAGPTGTTTETSASFSFTSSEANSTFECRLNATAWEVCASPRVYGNLPAGAHSFEARARDAAGNVDLTPAQRTWTIAAAPAPAPAPPTPTPPAPTPPATPQAQPTPPRAPAARDTRAPDDVRGVAVKAGNRAVTLTWQRPRASDFQRVEVMRSQRGRGERRVYGGRATSFTDRQLRNGVAYRYRIVSLDRAGNRSRGVAKTALPKAIVLFSPAAAARVQAPPLLRWLPSRGATYYNVQLFRGSQKVLSAWPKQPRLGLGSTWTFAGRKMRLQAGTYRWYVWPGIGARSRAKYGPMLGQSTFVVRA